MFLPVKLLNCELRRNGCFKDYLNYNKVIDKNDKCNERIRFLTKCRENDIIPKFLTFRVPTNGAFDDQSVHNFQQRLLLKEIDCAKKQSHEHSVNLDICRCNLKNKKDLQYQDRAEKLTHYENCQFMKT